MRNICWPKPWWADDSYSGKLVPYSELPDQGAGAIVSGAIREQLRVGGYSEDLTFMPFTVSGSACMNCGSQRLEVLENGGWCDRCSR